MWVATVLGLTKGNGGSGWGRGPHWLSPSWPWPYCAHYLPHVLLATWRVWLGWGYHQLHFLGLISTTLQTAIEVTPDLMSFIAFSTFPMMDTCLPLQPPTTTPDSHNTFQLWGTVPGRVRLWCYSFTLLLEMPSLPCHWSSLGKCQPNLQIDLKCQCPDSHPLLLGWVRLAF